MMAKENITISFECNDDSLDQLKAFIMQCIDEWHSQRREFIDRSKWQINDLSDVPPGSVSIDIRDLERLQLASIGADPDICNDDSVVIDISIGKAMIDAFSHSTTGGGVNP